jgi:crooked neck
MPKLVKKRRVIAGGYEEYVDPVFPDEEVGVNTKLLSMAHEWKLKMALAVNEDEEEDDDDDE